ncbi:hypothetical protein [Dyadobacter arcticus]|uniref:Outer membrane protein beta-barrel domain-containing protein n=1 Tax=Dyadobacter arcticus TaxID=1078754 RepID=A0ABX0UEV5_9BACT|nr:hypothetical protein [Dyadobacter arcticus]NIJ51447.1 hypothetical protein [Dyadobacter arcticus]
MKTLAILSAIITISLSQAQAQQNNSWEFGIQAEYGNDWYHRAYYEWESLPNGYIQDFPSYHSRGVGIFAERILNSQFSLLGQLNYTQKKMPVDMFGERSATGARWVTKEVHHRGSADIGLRWYVNPKSQLRFFVDGKLAANILIAAVQRVEGFGNVATWNAFGYDRIAPTVSGSAGIKWKRLAISVEYRHDLAPVKRNISRTGITSQALEGKVAFTLFRSGTAD